LGLLDKIDKEELLETIIERAAALTGTQHCYIYLLEPDEQVMQMRVGKGFFAEQLGRAVSKGQGMGGCVWQTEEPVLVADYSSWAGRLDDPALDGLHCIVGIPLKSDSQVQGVIGLAHVDPEKRFDQEDVIALERFAALALLALEKPPSTARSPANWPSVKKPRPVFVKANSATAPFWSLPRIPLSPTT
jgi:GAF domain-containing protein